MGQGQMGRVRRQLLTARSRCNTMETFRRRRGQAVPSSITQPRALPGGVLPAELFTPARARWRPFLTRLTVCAAVFLTIGAYLGDRASARLASVLHPAAATSPYALDDYPFASRTEDVRFPSLDGTTLAGWFIPTAEPDRPSVILMDGYGQSRASLLPQAGYLHAAGYNVLLFDFRGTGESDGTFTFGINEPLDVRGAVTYLLDQPGVDPDHVAVQGVSLGASIAILAAAEDARIRAVVAESAFTSLHAMIKQDFTRYSHLPRVPFAQLAVAWMQWRTGGSVAAVNPLRAVSGLEGRPLLLISDSRDEVVPAGSAERLFGAAPGPKELWTIEGTEHANGFLVFPHAYQERVLGFYGQYLEGTGAGATVVAAHAL